MGLFGPSKEEVWRQLSKEIGTELVEGGFWKGNHLEGRHQNWVIYLDTYTVSTGKTHTTYTRMRAPFVNKDQFSFKIYKSGIFSGMGKALGMQDIQVGYDPFDADYIIKGNHETTVQRLFANRHIRELIEKQPKLKLEIKENEGMFGPKFREDESELHFMVVGVIKDVDLLKSLFELFSAILVELEVLGCAKDETTQVNLYR